MNGSEALIEAAEWLESAKRLPKDTLFSKVPKSMRVTERTCLDIASSLRSRAAFLAETERGE